MDYILLTPVKNEEKHLAKFIKCIKNQTVKPKLWVIIDGKSTDESKRIISELCTDVDWIVLKDQETFSDIGGHINFSIAVKEGYDYAKYLCGINNINYDYVAKVDADILISNNFFQLLIENLKNNHTLGVVSGTSYTIKDNMDIECVEDIRLNSIQKDIFISNAMPDKRVYRKECLDALGGFPVVKYSPDSVLVVKIFLRGWQMQKVENANIYNMRKDSGTERNVWKASMMAGRGRYYLNYSPLLIAMGALYLMIKKPFYPGLAFGLGYSLSFIKKDDQINDVDVRDYFRHNRIYDLQILSILRNIIRRG